MASRKPCKVTKPKKTSSTKAKKAFSIKPRLPTIVEDAPSSFPNTINTNLHNSSTKLTLEAKDNILFHRPTANTVFNHNGLDFTLEECQLVCVLREMKTDYDLISEIIKYERKSRHSVDCTGLDEYIFRGQVADVEAAWLKGCQVVIPLLADVEAARIKAQDARAKWMEYMARVVQGYQIRGREHEVLEKVPRPFGWINLVPPRPLFGEIGNIPYSWNEPGWDIGPAMNLGTAWE